MINSFKVGFSNANSSGTPLLTNYSLYKLGKKTKSLLDIFKTRVLLSERANYSKKRSLVLIKIKPSVRRLLKIKIDSFESHQGTFKFFNKEFDLLVGHWIVPNMDWIQIDLKK